MPKSFYKDVCAIWIKNYLPTQTEGRYSKKKIFFFFWGFEFDINLPDGKQCIENIVIFIGISYSLVFQT